MDEELKIATEKLEKALEEELAKKQPDHVLRNIIRHEIYNSDCLIAIATPRYMDALSGVWRTFEWLHGEIGIAIGRDFPILILMNKKVTLGGSPINPKGVYNSI